MIIIPSQIIKKTLNAFIKYLEKKYYKWKSYDLSKPNKRESLASTICICLSWLYLLENSY